LLLHVHSAHMNSLGMQLRGILCGAQHFGLLLSYSCSLVFYFCLTPLLLLHLFLHMAELLLKLLLLTHAAVVFLLTHFLLLPLMGSAALTLQLLLMLAVSLQLLGHLACMHLSMIFSWASLAVVSTLLENARANVWGQYNWSLGKSN